jgi:hypothetical protein
MGHINDIAFVSKYGKIIKGPILEIGSKDYGSTQDFRSLFPNLTYVGVDQEEGKGVDAVIDMTDNFSQIDKKLKRVRFKTIICLSVFEHCKNPFKLAANLCKLLDRRGVVFISVPFSWRIHGYPDDYWRFTPSGIKALFSELNFDKYLGDVTTNTSSKRLALQNNFFRAELVIMTGLKQKRYGILTGIFIYLCRIFKILPMIFSHPYVYPPVQINMVGYKDK